MTNSQKNVLTDTCGECVSNVRPAVYIITKRIYQLNEIMIHIDVVIYFFKTLNHYFKRM